MARVLRHWQPVVNVQSVPFAMRVLQCPLLVAMSTDEMTLIVGSRDERNQGRILLVTLRPESGGGWVVGRCAVLLDAQGVPGGCVGVMPGGVTWFGDTPVLLGNAYFMEEGVLLSELFHVNLTDVLEGHSPVVSLIEDSERHGFRAVPRVLTLWGNRFLSFSAGTPNPSGGFPHAYGLRIVEVADDLSAVGASWDLLGCGSEAKAVVTLASDPAEDGRGWFCHRHIQGGGYQLGRCLLNDDGRATDVWWHANGELGTTPSTLEMLSYPEVLPDGRLIACAGVFGDQGLVMIELAGLEW